MLGEGTSNSQNYFLLTFILCLCSRTGWHRALSTSPTSHRPLWSLSVHQELTNIQSQHLSYWTLRTTSHPVKPTTSSYAIRTVGVFQEVLFLQFEASVPRWKVHSSTRTLRPDQHWSKQNHWEQTAGQVELQTTRSPNFTDHQERPIRTTEKYRFSNQSQHLELPVI